MTSAQARRGIGALAAIAALSGCSAIDLTPRANLAAVLARPAGWTERTIAAPTFDLVSFAPSAPKASDQPLAVYIEGDGLAFLGPHTVSPDPTPDEPIALELALRHPSGSVAYLARPCQYATSPARRPCDPSYWTSLRYSAAVVSDMSYAIDVLKRNSGARSVILVGYSGGGAVAALVSARRKDVVGLVTVAANLDLADWTSRHHLAPLDGSLDPADSAEALSGMPQVHLVGEHDRVVEPGVVLAFASRLSNRDLVSVVVVPRYTHDCCWVRDWPKLASRPELRLIPGWPTPP